MDTFDSIARANPEYVEALYRRYRADPRSVDERWALVFAGYDFALAGGPGASATGRTSPPVADLVHAYRELGHLVADVDPLDRCPRRHPLLELERVRLRGSATSIASSTASRSAASASAPLRELATALRRDLLRHARRRVPDDQRQGAARVAPGAHGAALATAPTLGLARTGVALARATRRGGDVRAVPPHELRGPEALLPRRRRGADPAPRHPRRGGGGRRRPRSS